MVNNFNILTRKGRINYAKSISPIFCRECERFEEAKRRTINEFRNKYGIFWRLRVSKESFKEKELDINIKLYKNELGIEW